jgi:hypothetical protein
MKKAIQIWEILLSLWIIRIFLWSLPYKFSWHEHTKFIFWTIWEWMSGILWSGVGNGFSNYWAYVIWVFELIVSIILISAFYFITKRQFNKSSIAFALGWLWAMFLMIWAVFFHMFTPLWIEVNDDGWSLFRAAVSIVFIGAFLAVYNGINLVKKVNQKNKN